MVLEIAQIEIKPGSEAQFEAAFTGALPLFRKARGCEGAELHRSIEHPHRYHLFVRWATLEDHTVHFRNSEDFQTWRQLVGPCFAQPPVVEHSMPAVQGF